MTNLQPRASLERFLNIFTEVRPGEAKTALLLALNIFLILMSYYVLKTVREALILGEGSAELKNYMSAGQIALLAVLIPYYGRLVKPFPASNSSTSSRCSSPPARWSSLSRRSSGCRLALSISSGSGSST